MEPSRRNQWQISGKSAATSPGSAKRRVHGREKGERRPRHELARRKGLRVGNVPDVAQRLLPCGERHERVCEVVTRWPAMRADSAWSDWVPSYSEASGLRVLPTSLPARSAYLSTIMSRSAAMRPTSADSILRSLLAAASERSTRSQPPGVLMLSTRTGAGLALRKV
jgi:hypothetical protein